MSDSVEPPSDPNSSEPSRGPADRNEQCDREFERYYKERDEWVKAQLDAERSYDALLATISTLALGASLTKDWVNRGGVGGQIVLILAWFAFAACLCLSLLHRYFTYYTHKKWVE